nr:MAG TPA: tail collar fiber protein [Caudoviricetes sp.]
MIFFFKSDGTLIKSAPETVYQGSAEAGKVYVVAPLNANMLVDVYYELPNGERWGAYLLENNGTVINNEELPDDWALWSTTLESAITQYAGTLKAQFGFYQSGTADKVPLITSQGVTITIAKGVVRDLPSAPTADVYAQIVNAISSIKQDIANLPNEYLSNTNEDKIALKNNGAVEYSKNATAGTIAKRDSYGKINVADGTEDLNAVNVRQLNAEKYSDITNIDLNTGDTTVEYDTELGITVNAKGTVTHENGAAEQPTTKFELPIIAGEGVSIDKKENEEKVEIKVEQSALEKIYGVDGVGAQIPSSLTRTDEAVGLTYTVGTSEITSDFDNCYPWSDIKEVTDSYGNVFIRIPKFYCKVTKNADGTYKYQISGTKYKGFSTLFVDGKGNEIDYILIGKYEASGDSTRAYSKSGKPVLVNRTRSQFRTACKANGAGYQQYDFLIDTIIKELWLVEMKTTNSQSVMMGYTNPDNAAALQTGTTDTILTPSGSPVSNTDGKHACKYRGIENPFGNAWKWCDGINFDVEKIYVCENPEYYADDKYDAPYTYMGDRVIHEGYLKEVTPFAKNPLLGYGTAISANGTTYYSDYYFFSADGTTLITGGGYNNSLPAGIWRFDGRAKSSYLYGYLGSRLCYKPLSSTKGGISVTPSGATVTATNGTFTSDEWATLQASDNNYILFNNEIYRLADKGHAGTVGIWSYTHTGWDGTAIMDKSINVTVSTGAWTLIVGKENGGKVYKHRISFKDGAATIYFDIINSVPTPFTYSTIDTNGDFVVMRCITGETPNYKQGIGIIESISNGYCSYGGVLYATLTANIPTETFYHTGATLSNSFSDTVTEL